MNGDPIAHSEGKRAALNLAALGTRQPDLAAELLASLETVGLAPPVGPAFPDLAGFWQGVLDHSGPRLVFGAAALCGYPEHREGRGVTLVVDHIPGALALALRDSALWGDLEAGRLVLAAPQDEFALVEEVKSLLRAGPDPAALHLAFTPGLACQEMEAYQKWGESVRRFIEFARDPTVLNLVTRCNTWLLALALTPLQETRPEIYREVTRYYNRRFQELDRGEPSYQRLVEI